MPSYQLNFIIRMYEKEQHSPPRGHYYPLFWASTRSLGTIPCRWGRRTAVDKPDCLEPTGEAPSGLSIPLVVCKNCKISGPAQNLLDQTLDFHRLPNGSHHHQGKGQKSSGRLLFLTYMQKPSSPKTLSPSSSKRATETPRMCQG